MLPVAFEQCALEFFHLSRSKGGLRLQGSRFRKVRCRSGATPCGAQKVLAILRGVVTFRPARKDGFIKSLLKGVNRSRA